MSSSCRTLSYNYVNFKIHVSIRFEDQPRKGHFPAKRCIGDVGLDDRGASIE